MYSGRLLYVSLILAWASVVGLPLLYYSGVVGMVAPAAASLSLAPGGLRVRAHLAPTAPLSTSTAARGWLSKLWPLRAAAAPSPVPPPPPATSTTPSACFLHTGRLREDAAAAAARACRDEQEAALATDKQAFYGGPGYDRIMGELFSREGNARFFSAPRALVMVHVGAHLGGMIERYAHLRRGPRLDDRLVMVEPNPANAERLARRIRADPRLVLRRQAVSNTRGRRWFAFSGTPNVLGNGGHVLDEEDSALAVGRGANVTDPEKVEGVELDVLTLDEILDEYPVVDFLFMDPEGFEPRIFLGAERTLSRVRFMVFGCSERWKDHFRFTTNKRTLQILEDAGLAFVMLGKDRNVILNEQFGPDRAQDRLTSWGFCAAIRIKGPPAVANVSALSLLVSGFPGSSPLAGPGAPVCARAVAASVYKDCRNDHK